jgi:SAM-dependent methyltransferase
LPWFYAVAERDHPLQNPTSAHKIRQLGEHVRLQPGQRVLDIACGRGGPALILASTFGCRVVGVEKAVEFAEVARERVAAADLQANVEIVLRDAREFSSQPDEFDVALCLGASFIWDGLPGTLAAMTPAVRAGGYVVVGEPFWRTFPDGLDDMGYTDLAGTFRRFEAAGLAVVGLIASSEDDWDAYESLHWRALEEWLAANATDPDAAEIGRQHRKYRDAYMRTERDLLGWAIVIGWKRDARTGAAA